MQLGIEQKLLFCRSIQAAHEDDVSKYNDLSDFFDRTSFAKRVEASIQRLMEYLRQEKMSIDDLEEERGMLRGFMDRLASDLKEE
jgi:hypothetical protein